MHRSLASSTPGDGRSGDSGDAVVTKIVWCINWIRPSIYLKPCRNRRDSPFAARSPSTDTPNFMGQKKKKKKNLTRPGLEPWNPSQTVRAPGPPNYRAALSIRDTWVTQESRITIGKVYDLFRTARGKSSLRKKMTTFFDYDSPVLPAATCLLDRANIRGSEYSVSRSAERRGRPISVKDCVYRNIHFIIFFVRKMIFNI